MNDMCSAHLFSKAGVSILERISSGEIEKDAITAESIQQYATHLLAFINTSKVVRAWEVTLPRGRTLSYTGNEANGDKPLYECPPMFNGVEGFAGNKVWPKEIHDFVSLLPTFELLEKVQQDLLKNCLLRILIEKIPLNIFFGK